MARWFRREWRVIKFTVKSKMSRNPAVISAITALYLLNIVQAAAQWVWTDRFLILTGQSSQAAYIYASTGGSWFYLVSNINGSLLGTIADSLLVRFLTLQLSSLWLYPQIWRCYNVWNSSLRVILVPLALLLIGIGKVPSNHAVYIQASWYQVLRRRHCKHGQTIQWSLEPSHI